MNFYKTEMTGKEWVTKVASANERSASLMMNKGSQTLIPSAGQRSRGKTNIAIRMSGK